jgi:hypothetical protein
MDDVWYYAARDQSVGPISLANLIQVLSRTNGARDVLVWRDGFANWEKASSVSELAVHVIKPPPLPAAPPPLPRRTNPEISPPIIAIDERQLSESVSKDEGEPVGIGGWLVVIALGRIYGPLALLVWMGDYYKSLDSSFWTIYPFVAYSEAALNVAALALSLWTTVLFFKKSKLFPIFFIYNAIASVSLLPIDLLLGTTAGQSIQAMISFVTQKEGVQWGQAVIGALVWIPYVKMSKRVANTFIH